MTDQFETTSFEGIVAGLEGLVPELAQARAVVENFQDIVDYHQAMVEASPAWLDLQRAKAKLEQAKTEAATLRAIAEADALECFLLDGNKNPHPAVQVKEMTALGYTYAEAIEYCRQHLPNALKLDKRKFEQVAKVADLDFVTITMQAKGYVKRDLSSSAGS